MTDTEHSRQYHEGAPTQLQATIDLIDECPRTLWQVIQRCTSETQLRDALCRWCDDAEEEEAQIEREREQEAAEGAADEAEQYLQSVRDLGR